MKEDFLYHIWKFQKFNSEGLRTSENDQIKIVNPGFQNELAGPDFFNAKVQIGEQLWAGNVEMHIKSSDWYFHQHETDPNYDNVILHVVWDHDVDIFRKNGSKVPTLILKDRVENSMLQAYKNLITKDYFKINCENDFKEFSDFQVEHWLERLYFERLEEKSKLIFRLLDETGNNWEAVLFAIIFKSFGLNVNSDSFLGIARSIDFRIIQKIGDRRLTMEALLLGQAGLLKNEDKYSLELMQEYEFLRNKYSLYNKYLESPQYFRLRPDNFPNIRLAQLAALYAKNKSIFYALIEANTVQDLKNIFDLEISEYWKTHYNSGKEHKSRNKKLSSNFIDLLLINCVVPLKYCYSKFIGHENDQHIQELISSIKLEKNSIIQIFNELRPKTAKNAMDSQALLQLKNEYCNLNKCLQCELGASLLRKSHKYI
ncbi:MAG TPA: DUF2851 family protein [Christiangramia sp.]|nr:DUF2851 family protein [Christiangramia sp.]